MSGTNQGADALTIGRIGELVAALPPRERALVDRLFQIVVSEGETVPPPEMSSWIERSFGSVEAVRRQRVVRVLNRWTFEGAVFNPLRAHRPGAGTSSDAPPDKDILARIEAARPDDFCDPFNKTPADIFGRVRGRHMLTGANVAKADGWHSVAIFEQHNPLAIDAALVEDVLHVAEEWATRVRVTDAEARYLFVLWNCLWRAGASLVHGHAQLTLSHDMPQARVELWHAAAQRYRQATRSDYFADLVEAQTLLGLTFTSSSRVRGFASLTPAKEREVVLLAPDAEQYNTLGLSALARPLAQGIARAKDALGVRAFNVGVFGPPYGSRAEWEGFPLVARFVDRGNPLSSTADIAAMELFGSSVVAADPFEVARALRQPSGSGW